MYDTFELKRLSEGRRITGYHWRAAQPAGVVVLIHGVGEYAAAHGEVAEQLLAAGYAVVSMDLRGHGRSFGVRGHCAPRAEILKDIDELVEYAKIVYPGVPPVMYGHSMGGNLVLDYKGRGKYNGEMAAYIITSPWLLLVKRYSRPAVLSIRAAAKAAPKKKILSIVEEGSGRFKKHAPRHQDPLLHDWITLQTVAEGFTIGRAIAEGSFENNGRADGTPMLVMHGTEDTLCDIEGSRLLAAHEGAACTLVEWEGLPHQLRFGNEKISADTVIGKMTEFLRAAVLR